MPQPRLHRGDVGIMRQGSGRETTAMGCPRTPASAPIFRSALHGAAQEACDTTQDFLAGHTQAAAWGWWNDNCVQLAASLAFYTALSLAPLVIIVVGLAAW